MVPNARRRAHAFPTKRAHPDEDRSDRPPGAPFTFHERDPQRGDAAKPLGCLVSLDRGASQRAPERLASSASGVTRRRSRRFCHWYRNVMAKPMLTFLADPRRPLAETSQDVFLTTGGGTHTQSRFASGFEGAFALPSPAVPTRCCLSRVLCSHRPLAALLPQGGAWPERMQPRKSTLDTLRHRSSDPEHVETHSGPSTLVSRAIEDPCSHAFPRRSACDRRPEVPSVESRAGLRLDWHRRV